MRREQLRENGQKVGSPRKPKRNQKPDLGLPIVSRMVFGSENSTETKKNQNPDLGFQNESKNNQDPVFGFPLVSKNNQDESKRNQTETIEGRSRRDHDLDRDRSLIEPEPNSLSGRAGERAAVPVESAQPAESGTTGDHAARARQDDPKPVAQVASESKEAFIRRFVGAFRANTPPEPQISFHGDETPAFASSTPPPTTSPISPRGALPDDSQKEDASCH